MTLHQTLYRKLTVLIPTLPQVPEYVKSQVPLSHYYEQNGDLIADPDMVVRIDTKIEAVEALSFQDTYTYREVYLDGDRVDLKPRRS